MFWPRARDYREAIPNLQVSFRDPELSAGQAMTNAMGLPMTWTGNFAAVFQVRDATAQRNWAVKCFTRHVDSLQERYRQIDDHLRQQRLPFMVGFSYLPDEVWVRGQRYPLLKMDWVDGLRLDEFLGDLLTKPDWKSRLRRLCEMWLRLAQMLRDAQVAHGDLQHGNVLLVPVPGKEETYLAAPDQSSVFRELWQLEEPAIRNLVGHLTLAAKGPLQDAPLLSQLLLDSKVVALTEAQQGQVGRWPSPATRVPVIPPTPAMLEQPTEPPEAEVAEQPVTLSLTPLKRERERRHHEVDRPKPALNRLRRGIDRRLSSRPAGVASDASRQVGC